MSDTRVQVEAPEAFVSYAHRNKESVIRLTQEAKLRGFHVFRDEECIRQGERLQGEIEDALARSDLLLVYLTPESLASDAVVEKEVKPALRAQARDGRPVVIPVACRLGETHQEVQDRTYARLLMPYIATWLKPLGDMPEPLPLDDAARIARQGLESVLGAERGPADGHWRLHLCTRGERESGGSGLLVDATDFLGGASRQVGDPAAWARVWTGLSDLQAVLKRHSERRQLHISGQAHLTGGTVAGFAFGRSRGWQLTVRADDQSWQVASDAKSHPGLKVMPDLHGGTADFLSVEVNLLDKQMDPAVERVLSAEGMPTLRLRIESADRQNRVSCDDLSAMAATVAHELKNAAAAHEARRVLLFLAAPLAFSVFLGAELEATGSFIQLYEYQAHRYHPSLELNAT
jgi:hypothetical protein